MIDLRFDGVSKRYRIRQRGVASQVRPGWFGKLLGRPTTTELWAVRNVSFEVPTGQALGIIGPNGAGKSTILKLLSNVTAPTAGEITTRGRVSALLEVGSGFHDELTGRENVFLSGSVLGMRRREIHSKLDSIIEFAGVRPFLDEPVKRYSSGMRVRLGFSIAAHLEPDVLLLDEVLAVGDAAFQEKCTGRILELKRRGMTILFISHDLNSVERLCDRVLLMQRGEIAYDGSPAAAIARYHAVPPLPDR
jgi:lipopolysaccharide transport system ATP-binding protein